MLIASVLQSAVGPADYVGAAKQCCRACPTMLYSVLQSTDCKTKPANHMHGVAEHVLAYMVVVASALQDLPGKPNAFACPSFCFKAMPKQNEKQPAVSNANTGGNSSSSA